MRYAFSVLLVFHFIKISFCQGACSHFQFSCTDGVQCISEKEACDGFQDCDDGSDETLALCKDRPCRVNFLTLEGKASRCDYGACIPNQFICDGVVHCDDGSDEVAEKCNRGKCPMGKFKCDYGACLSDYLLCDGYPHCLDGSDETTECNGMTCQFFEWQCRYGACTRKVKRCNGKVDCLDGSDEMGCGDGRKSSAMRFTSYYYGPKHLGNEHMMLQSSTMPVDPAFNLSDPIALLSTEPSPTTSHEESSSSSQTLIQITTETLFTITSTKVTTETPTKTTPEILTEASSEISRKPPPKIPIETTTETLAKSTKKIPTAVAESLTTTTTKDTTETLTKNTTAVSMQPSTETTASPMSKHTLTSVSPTIDTQPNLNHETTISSSTISNVPEAETISSIPSNDYDVLDYAAILCDKDYCLCPSIDDRFTCYPCGGNANDYCNDQPQIPETYGCSTDVVGGSSIEVLECGTDNPMHVSEFARELPRRCLTNQTLPPRAIILAKCWDNSENVLECHPDGNWEYYMDRRFRSKDLCQYEQLNSPLCGRLPFPRRDIRLRHSSPIQPWVTGLMVGQTTFCPATIISTRWVLIHINCLKALDFLVQISQEPLKIQYISPKGQLTSIKALKSHRLTGVVALLELEEPIKFSSYCAPICVFGDVIPHSMAIALTKSSQTPTTFTSWNFVSQTVTNKNLLSCMNSTSDDNQLYGFHTGSINNDAQIEITSPLYINTGSNSYARWSLLGLSDATNHTCFAMSKYSSIQPYMNFIKTHITL